MDWILLLATCVVVLITLPTVRYFADGRPIPWYVSLWIGFLSAMLARVFLAR